jgi:hypothetical protein
LPWSLIPVGCCPAQRLLSFNAADSNCAIHRINNCTVHRQRSCYRVSCGEPMCFSKSHETCFSHESCDMSRTNALSRAVTCCTVLSSAVMCCVVLYHAVSPYVAMRHSIRYAMICMLLPYPCHGVSRAVSCPTLLRPILSCPVLCCPIMYCPVLSKCLKSHPSRVVLSRG